MQRGKNEPQDKGCMESPEIQEEEKKGFSAETSEAAWPCRHLDSELREEICCFKPPNPVELHTMTWENPGTQGWTVQCGEPRAVTKASR